MRFSLFLFALNVSISFSVMGCSTLKHRSQKEKSTKQFHFLSGHEMPIEGHTIGSRVSGPASLNTQDFAHAAPLPEAYDLFHLRPADGGESVQGDPWTNVGVSIPSPCTGTVNDTNPTSEGSAGKVIEILCESPAQFHGYAIRMAHFESIGVKLGDKVLMSQYVGVQGETGRCVPGPGQSCAHVHVEIYNRRESLVRDRHTNDLVARHAYFCANPTATTYPGDVEASVPEAEILAALGK